MNDTKVERLEKLRCLLLSLLVILKRESEEGWLRSIKVMLDKVDMGLLDHADSKETIDCVARMYRAINGGSGSFSDFYVWRDNFDDRKKENDKLKIIKDDLWNFLN